MKTALVISSSVAASHVGASASAFCLQRLGINTIVLPTTLFGRHPGWGAPGGQTTNPDLLRDIWHGVRAQNITIDGIMTGYMGHLDHVKLAQEIIQTVKTSNPDIPVLVDPVMGDSTENGVGRLYIKETVAKAIQARLLPLATLATPNVWELSYLAGQTPTSTASVIELARHVLPCAGLVSSIALKDRIGALYVDTKTAKLVSHKKFAAVPNGGGDSLAGTFFAHILNGVPPHEALARATASIFSILQTAHEIGAKEIPLIQCQDALETTEPLEIETFTTEALL